MDYLQKAIEQARKARSGRYNSPRSNVESDPIADSEDQFAGGIAQSRAKSNTEKGISYVETRQVELNPKVMLENRVVAYFEGEERTEPYRQLRTLLLREFHKNKWRTLAITSARNNEGKTLTAVNTALTLARDVNQTVLLVDLDFKDPDVADTLGLNVDMGFVEFLKGEVSLPDVMINPGVERLVILPSTPVQGSTSEILSSPRMAEALKDLIERFDDRIIIFDLPPLLRDDDALVFTPYVDASLLVVEYGSTQREEIERCLHLLQGTNLVGTVLNKVR